jgi:hypothetical protein
MMFVDNFLHPHEKNGMDTAQWLDQYENEQPFWGPARRAYAREVLARDRWLHWYDWALFKTPQGYLGRCPVDTLIKEQDDPESYEDGHNEYLAIVCCYGAPCC